MDQVGATLSLMSHRERLELLMLRIAQTKGDQIVHRLSEVLRQEAKKIAEGIDQLEVYANQPDLGDLNDEWDR